MMSSRRPERYFRNLIANKSLSYVIRNWFPHSYMEHRKLSFQVQRAKALSPQIDDAQILSVYCNKIFSQLKSDLQGAGQNFRGIETLEPFRPDEIEVEPFPLVFHCRDCHRMYRDIESLPHNGKCQCAHDLDDSHGRIYQISQIFICPICGEIKTVWDANRQCRCSAEHIHYQILDAMHPYSTAQIWCDIHQWRKLVRESMFCSICRRPLDGFPVSSSFLSPAREVFVEGEFVPSPDHEPLDENIVGQYEIESVTFGRLNIVELIYGYRVDVPGRVPNSNPPVRPFMHPTDDDKALALSRVLKTRGLKIKFNDKVMKDVSLQEYVFLHTFKHLMLWASPPYTGLDVGEIQGVVSVGEPGTIFLYDSQPGGIGGCEALANPNKFLGLVDYAKRFIRDHTGCVDACKKCLFLPHGVCKDLNRNLDRKLLLQRVYQIPAKQQTPWEDVELA
jgi:hypothetical protein